MFAIQEKTLIGQAIADTSAVARHALGTIIRAKDPLLGASEHIYLKGAASTALGSVVIYNRDDFSTSLLVANDIGPVAVAMSACGANQFGWYQIFGKAVVKARTAADNANVYATGTPGLVGDAVGAGDRMINSKFASAMGMPSTGLAECEIWRPFMDDGAAA